MTEDELVKIPRRSPDEILNAIPGGPGYKQRVLLQLECHMNIEWWRGYHAGRASVPQKDVLF